MGVWERWAACGAVCSAAHLKGSLCSKFLMNWWTDWMFEGACVCVGVWMCVLKVRQKTAYSLYLRHRLSSSLNVLLICVDAVQWKVCSRVETKPALNPVLAVLGFLRVSASLSLALFNNSSHWFCRSTLRGVSRTAQSIPTQTHTYTLCVYTLCVYVCVLSNGVYVLFSAVSVQKAAHTCCSHSKIFGILHCRFSLLIDACCVPFSVCVFVCWRARTHCVTPLTLISLLMSVKLCVLAALTPGSEKRKLNLKPQK